MVTNKNSNFYKQIATILITAILTITLLTSLFPSQQILESPPTATQNRLEAQQKEFLNFETHQIEIPLRDHDTWDESEIPLFDSSKGKLEFVEIDLRVTSEYSLVGEDESQNTHIKDFEMKYPRASILFFENPGDDIPYFFSSTLGPPSSKLLIQGPYDGTTDWAGTSGNEEPFLSKKERQFPSTSLKLTEQEDFNYFTKTSGGQATKSMKNFNPGAAPSLSGPTNADLGLFTLIGGELFITYGYTSSEKSTFKKPEVPTNFQVSTTLPFVHITWDKSSEATNYAVFKKYYQVNGNPPTEPPCETNTILATLDDVDEFKDIENYLDWPTVYAIMAIGPGGQGECSDWVNGRGIGPEGDTPSPPQNFIASQNLNGEIDLTWDPSAAIPGIYGEPEGYEIKMATWNQGPYWIVHTTNNPLETSYTQENLAPGTYYFRIKSFNDWGFSEYSDKAIGIAL